MRAAFASLCVGAFLLLGGVAQADDAAPSKTEIALDIEVTSGAADVRIDGIPFFGPGQVFEAEASIIASLPANGLFGPGQNEISLNFDPDLSKPGNVPVFRARLGYAPAGSYPDAFSERPYAVLVDIRADADQPEGYRLDYRVEGQPLLTAQPTKPDLVPHPDGSFEVTLDLDVGIDLPKKAWKEGRVLRPDAATRAEVEAQMRRAHAGLAEGPVGIKRELGPMIERLAATEGLTLDEAIDTEFVAYSDPSFGFELQPFDASKSRLIFFGKRRLATLVPSPVVFLNKEINETGGPLLLYWQDERGAWQILH